MPTPQHLRHPAPHPPHRHTTRIPSPLLLSILHPLATLYRLAILDRYITTPYLLPLILYLSLDTLPLYMHLAPTSYRTL